MIYDLLIRWLKNYAMENLLKQIELEIQNLKTQYSNLRSWEWYINFDSEKTKINKIINECINLSKLK